jgi:hypothetical protein
MLQFYFVLSFITFVQFVVNGFFFNNVNSFKYQMSNQKHITLVRSHVMLNEELIIMKFKLFLKAGKLGGFYLKLEGNAPVVAYQLIQFHLLTFRSF